MTYINLQYNFFNALKTFRKMLETSADDNNEEGLSGEPRRGTKPTTPKPHSRIVKKQQKIRFNGGEARGNVDLLLQCGRFR